MDKKQYLKHQKYRIELLKKADENYKPTKEELKNAYGYLSYCLNCDKKIRRFEAFTHGFEGNTHKFGCSIFLRFLGVIYSIFKIIFWIIIFIPMLIICGVEFLIKKIKEKWVKQK